MTPCQTIFVSSHPSNSPPPWPACRHQPHYQQKITDPIWLSQDPRWLIVSVPSSQAPRSGGSGSPAMRSPEGRLIRCLKCSFQPPADTCWRCKCGHAWNAFWTAGLCPACHSSGKLPAAIAVTKCPDISPDMSLSRNFVDEDKATVSHFSWHTNRESSSYTSQSQQFGLYILKLCSGLTVSALTTHPRTSIGYSAICQQLKRSRSTGEPHFERDHSCLSAIVGSTPLARKAGMKPANPAATVRTIAEPRNVNGSRGLNP